MNNVVPIGTQISYLRKLFSANASAALTIPTVTATEPTGNGILTPGLENGGGFGNAALFAFYGTRTSADNETFTARITGWQKTDGGTAALWVPIPFLTLTLTQGTSVGVAASDVIATEYFADTIVVGTAFTTAYEIVSPVDNSIGYVKVDTLGCSKVQVQLLKGTNTLCNALGRMF